MGDIRNLPASEIQEFRSKLDDVLKVGTLQSKWQELGNLHGDWCYHYQEAFVFWHRAYLLYVEALIDFPIPYWDGFAEDTANPGSEFAGIPSIFLEDTYVHPSGEIRPLFTWCKYRRLCVTYGRAGVAQECEGRL